MVNVISDLDERSDFYELATYYVEDKIKNLDNPGGFYSYDLTYTINITNNNFSIDALQAPVNNFVSTLNDNTIYSILPVAILHNEQVSEKDLKINYHNAVDIVDNIFKSKLINNKLLDHDRVISNSPVPKDFNSLKTNPLFAPMFDPFLINHKNPINSKYNDNLSYEVVQNNNIFNVSVFDSNNVLVFKFLDNVVSDDV
ncbi:hypothetical protein BB560_000021 [Smittium megazygosporum]|uniref:Uncharacterized protein n=1 Tax=Smittium megazygosporum TaxID=133381 RepID=A0A2T9ZLJ0_9FUNG|nr:hypothetical protein BB560_000021 [Smittium megazygosporum]